jgi:MerR family transcriptional regulator, heat shock protein HspR
MTTYYQRKQVIELFGLDEAFLATLEDEELVCTVSVESCTERVFPPEQVERLRIIHNLVHDLDVNLPGVEVVLGMRENMILMERQFHEILDTLVQELKSRLRES